MAVSPLSPDALLRRCDPSALPFETTEDLTPVNGLMGQERAIEAIRFGTRISHRGYNLFILGPNRSGHDRAVRRLLGQIAAEEPVPSDWVYVNNFASTNEPQALRLKTGEGRHLRDRVKSVIDDLSNALPAIFQSDEYLHRRKAIEDALERKHRDALGTLQQEAESQGIALLSTPNGLHVAPIKDGDVMPAEDFAALPEEERDRITGLIDSIEDQVEEVFRLIPRWEAERVEKLRHLNQEFANFAVGHSINDLRDEFQGDEDVLAWFDALADDIVEHVSLFAPEADHSDEESPSTRPGQPEKSLERYEVNLFVNHSGATGAPVVTLDHPTLGNLVGRVEHRTQMGALVTDPGLIRPGALHLANGGYLLIDALRMLREPLAWDALKRALTNMEAIIESPTEHYAAIQTVTLKPEPIPLDVKVVLFGPPNLYYMLAGREPDFPRLFKVQVDFSDRIDRSDELDLRFARLVATLVREEGLKPVDASGVARVIERSARLAGDGGRLSILSDPLVELLSEADYCARETGAEIITAEHVDEALSAQIARADRLRERAQESITSEMMLVDTEGERAGQINSLLVRSLPNFQFGLPSRVTARVRPGGNGVLNIDRTVGFGRSVYNKGVEILSAWFLSQFATDRPIQFTATIVHEQSYGLIDGDSASSTELYALLSALSETPITQTLAVTGSVNQFGEVQVVGGVNEKIEGFYDICAARGLTGEQGVMIPAGNVRNLMLRRDIVGAAEQGLFHIYPVQTIEEGIELLTGVPAGEPNDEGHYPEGTIYNLVARRIKDLAPGRGNGPVEPPRPAPALRRWWWPF